MSGIGGPSGDVGGFNLLVVTDDDGAVLRIRFLLGARRRREYALGEAIEFLEGQRGGQGAFMISGRTSGPDVRCFGLRVQDGRIAAFVETTADQCEKLDIQAEALGLERMAH